MNRRTVVTGAALMPLAAAGQLVPDNIALARKVIEDGYAREAALHETLLKVWGWLDKWRGSLDKDERMELLTALGPDPGIRIAD